LHLLFLIPCLGTDLALWDCLYGCHSGVFVSVQVRYMAIWAAASVLKVAVMVNVTTLAIRHRFGRPAAKA